MRPGALIGVLGSDLSGLNALDTANTTLLSSLTSWLERHMDDGPSV